MENKLAKIGEMRVPLEIVLGRTEKKISEVAGFSPGSIIQFDSLAGEPVDLVAAGEVIAKGEVVIIDENFGLRVTQILDKKE